MKRKMFSSGPQFIELHPTNVCNSNCVFCNQKCHHNGLSIDFHLLQNVLTCLICHGLKTIRLSGGGEPLCYPHFSELIKILQLNKISIVGLNTNGILLNRYSEILSNYDGLRKICISLQAPTAISWSDLTGNKPELFDIIIDSLKKYAKDNKYNQEIILSFVLCESTINQIDKMVELATLLNAHCFLQDLNCFSYSDSFIKKVLSYKNLFNKYDKDKLTCYFSNIAEIRHISTYHNTNNVITNKKPMNFCTAPWTGLLVRPNGDCYICCALGGNKHIVGNLLKNEILDIWYSQKLHDIRKEAYAFLINDMEMSPTYFMKRCKDMCCVHYSLFSNLEQRKRIMDYYDSLCYENDELLLV